MRVVASFAQRRPARRRRRHELRTRIRHDPRTKARLRAIRVVQRDDGELAAHFFSSASNSSPDERPPFAETLAAPHAVRPPIDLGELLRNRARRCPLTRLVLGSEQRALMSGSAARKTWRARRFASQRMRAARWPRRAPAGRRRHGDAVPDARSSWCTSRCSCSRLRRARATPPPRPLPASEASLPAQPLASISAQLICGRVLAASPSRTRSPLVVNRRAITSPVSHHRNGELLLWNVGLLPKGLAVF